MTESLSEFAENTLQHLKAEGSLLARGSTSRRCRRASATATRSSSPAGPGHKRDLRIVRPYIRDFKPVLVGVDGGADALIEAGYRPDVIVGDMDSVSDAALKTGAELLVHAYRGTATRPARRGRRRSASRTRSCPRWGSARTSRCCSRTRRAQS